MPRAAATTSKVPAGESRLSTILPTDLHKAIKGKAVILIDDVMTTGATVSACAAQLRRAGARQVEVLTYARAMREGTRGA